MKKLQRMTIGSLVMLASMTVASATFTPSAQSQSPTTVKIVSTLPMTGSSLGQTQTIVNAITQALEDRNSTVCNGTLKIDFQQYDDATAAAGKWEPAQVASNANRIAADKDVVAVIGHFNSGAAKISLPILNKANLVMVSPANTYAGLTKPGMGEAGEPEVYYPSGKRNYARVIPSDDIQGAVAARWAQGLGAKTVYILDDQELYGIGVADVFEKTAKELGLTVAGREGIDGKASDYRALMTKIKNLNPDLIYYGGITQNNAGQLVKDMRNVGMTDVKFMGPDGIQENAFIEAAGRDGEGVYATFGGLPPATFQGAAKTWYDAYKAKFNSEPEPYAIYGFEAAQVVLNALDKVCKNDREAVRAAILETRDFSGALGTWSFDANGDTSLSTYGGYQVKDGKWEFVDELS
ncbi:MAG: hypothetical protein OHK0012_08800 [Synechococcales cyanobacterium]